MVYGLYGMLEFLNMVDMDRWKTGVSNAEYLVHLVRMKRLSACAYEKCV